MKEFINERKGDRERETNLKIGSNSSGNPAENLSFKNI
jgi:hypothetical protein